MLSRALLLLALCVAPAAAQGRYAGTWTIRAWRPAPWLDEAAAKAVRPSAPLSGKQLTFGARAIRGPELLACPRAKYELIAMPYEGLFEGGLTKPAEQAKALGFGAAPVQTLRAGCDFDFHFVSRTKGYFALDNVLWTFTRSE